MKKIISMVLSFILILGCSTTAFAAETHNYDTENLPHDGADYFETEIKADEENEERISDFVTVYGYQYTKGSLKSGAWRNGTSGGSSTSSAKLSLNYTQDTSYNISFKASVSGGYTNGGTIGSELGVTLGASKSYSLGSGYSVTVPKGSHYLIKYRPMYYTYKVVETKYKERYNEALGGMERYVVETKTCYVDVFSHWDFTHVAKYRQAASQYESAEKTVAQLKAEMLRFKGKRKLTQEMVDLFVAQVRIYENKNLEIVLNYEDELKKFAELNMEREAG